MWSPESEINSIAMATTMRHSQSSSSGEFVDKKKVGGTRPCAPAASNSN